MDTDKILIIDEFQKINRSTEREKREIDTAAFLAYQSRIEKHFLKGLLHLGMTDYVCTRSFRKEGFDIGKYSLIIVTEMNENPLPFFKYLRRENPECHLIYQYWNPISTMNLRNKSVKDTLQNFLSSRDKYNFEVVSFDRGDCKKYNLIYGPQYIRSKINKKNQYLATTDIFFVGKDKNRLEFLCDVKNTCSRLGISFKMWIVPDDRHKIYQEEEKKYIVPTLIPYETIIEEDQKSKAIFDVTQKGQEGITWRPIEALLLERKLITTFTDIVHYDFYRKENIFIWGQDDLNTLREFLDSPYLPVEREIMEQYTFDGWLKNLYYQMGWDFGEILK